VIRRLGIAWTCLLLGFAGTVVGQSRSDAQLLSAIDRPVAALGESVVLTVELLVSPRNDAEADSIRARFERLDPNLPEDDIELVRRYSVTERSQEMRLERPGRSDLRVPVVYLKRKFVIRPKATGLLQIPGFSIKVRAKNYGTTPHELHAYRIEGDFLRAQRAVFPIVVESRIQSRGDRRFMGTGSAFLVAEDALVTAYHVVVNAHRITATLPNGRRVRIKKVWSIDPRRDVAVLQIDSKAVREANIQPLALAPVEFANSWRAPPEADRVVFTTGWPDGMQQSAGGVLFHVSQLYDDDAIWLSSNRVRPGDSGGPLLDRRGRVIGVVSYGMSSADGGGQLLENVSTATDPRPAITQRLLTERPEGLGAFRDEDFFAVDPEARAVKVMSLLTEFAHLRRGSDPRMVRGFLSELDVAVEQGYEVSRLHFLQGSIYQMLGRFADASDAYERTLSLRENHYPAAYSLAYCNLAMRLYDEAANLFDFTSHFEPYRDLAEYGLAQASLQLLRYDDAIYHLRRIIHHHDDFAPALYLLGRAYVGNGDEEAAARILVKLRATSPGWGELLDRSIRVSPFRPVQRHVIERAEIRTLR